MSFGRDFERALVEAARDGAKELTLKNARAARSAMGSRGVGITFTWRRASGGSLERLGNLSVSGPTDEAVQEFHALLRQRMGQ